MSDPALAGYNPSSSLIQAVGGVSIKPMMGGAQLQGGAQSSDVKDVKLFSKVYKLPNPESFADDASLNANEDIKQIMTTLRFNTFPFLEKKKILKAIYDSNCSNETDLALDCGCDPVRKVIADLATILLEKTAASGPIDVVKKASTSFVEISIRIPIDKINVIMGKSSAAPAVAASPAPIAAAAPAAASFEQVVGENEIPKIAELKQKVKANPEGKLLGLELEAERAEFEVRKLEGITTRNAIQEKELQQKMEYAVEARKKFTNALAASKPAAAPPASAVASQEAAAPVPEAASSQNIQGNLQTMFPGQTSSGTKPVFLSTNPEQGATAPSIEGALTREENMAGGNQSRKLRRGN